MEMLRQAMAFIQMTSTVLVCRLQNLQWKLKRFIPLPQNMTGSSGCWYSTILDITYLNQDVTKENGNICTGTISVYDTE